MKYTRMACAMTMSFFSSYALAQAYTIQEIPTQTYATNSFALSIDNSGMVLSTTQNIYNPPIDVSLLPFDSESFLSTLTDPDSARAGNFNDEDYASIVARTRLLSENQSQISQQLGEYISVASYGQGLEYIQGRDRFNTELNSFEYALDTIAVGSVDGTFVLANSEGPFNKIPYTNENGDLITYILPDFDQRALVQSETMLTSLVPEDITLGGSSLATDINQNYQVIGSMSVAPTEFLTTTIDNCNDDELRGDIPVESCLRSALFTASASGLVRRPGLWLSRAAIWELSPIGEVVNRINLGLSFEPDEEEAVSSNFFSTGNAINNNGKAVGVSSVLFNDSIATSAATLYENGLAIRILEDDDLLPNAAADINDLDIVIGSRTQRINGFNREKMFIHDLTANETTFVNGFFESSGTTPRAINNSNVVVGNAEIDSITNGTRRRVGFLYDYNQDLFIDLNTQISCDSAYDIIEAVDINDNGVIAATALVQRPVRDVRGEILLDDDGEQTFIDTVVSLIMTPTDGSAQDCSTTVDTDIATTERQGASSTFLIIMFLGLIAFIRRAKHLS